VNPDLTMALRLLLSAVIGAVIGFQRERAGKAAGLRIHILICMGAALFTLVSIYGFDTDLRIAAGIVTGVGFLGAGAIINTGEGIVQGLTTAASIWISAGIGLAAGAGLPVLATVATVLTLIVLMIHPKIAR
jgi:putative Mg2+ transporter-C (MgtC) family protein